MLESEKKDIALKFIKALGSRDGNALRSIMTDDVVWSLPGKSPMSGEANGVDAILKRSETLHRYAVQIEVEHVVYGFQDVALHLHNTGKQDEKVLDEHLTTVCRLRENKIHRLDTFISDVDMLNRFFV